MQNKRRQRDKLHEAMKTAGERPIKIFATDVHPGSLERASRGVYDEEALANVPRDRILRYVRAGIPPPEVLRMATLTSALVVGANGERGVIAPGKLADLILVDGDPSVRIGDIDHIDLVMKGGKVYDPARIEAALGIAPARGRL